MQPTGSNPSNDSSSHALNSQGASQGTTPQQSSRKDSSLIDKFVSTVASFFGRSQGVAGNSSDQGSISDTDHSRKRKADVLEKGDKTEHVASRTLGSERTSKKRRFEREKEEPESGLSIDSKEIDSREEEIADFDFEIEEDLGFNKGIQEDTSDINPWINYEEEEEPESHLGIQQSIIQPEITPLEEENGREGSWELKIQEAIDKRDDRRVCRLVRDHYVEDDLLIKICRENLIHSAQEVLFKKQSTIRGNDFEYLLLEVCEKGYIEVAELLIRAGVSPTVLTDRRETVLHLACEKGYYNIVSLLLKIRSINVNQLTLSGLTPIQLACYSGQNDVVKLLVHSGKADINVHSRDRLSPLEIAFQKENKELLKILLRNNRIHADVRDKKGNTLLHQACNKGLDLEMISILLEEHKIDSNAINMDGHTALHLALQKGHYQIALALIDNGFVDVNLKDKEESAPLHNACVQEAQIEIFKQLMLREDIHVNARNREGNTPLHLAVMVSNVMVCKELMLRSEINLNSVNQAGLTPLEIALNNEDKEVLALLLGDPRIIADIRDERGNTLLHQACDKGMSLDIISILLESRKIDPNVLNCDQETALSITLDKGYDQAAVRLIQTPFVDINIQNKDGQVPLHQACGNNMQNIIACLLEQDRLDPDLKDISGNTPLFFAYRQNNFEFVMQLIGSKRLNLNVTDNDGSTLLHLSSDHGQINIVRAILDSNNVYINLVDAQGHTALYYASSQGYSEIVALLLKAGANPAIREHQTSPLAIALEKQHGKCIRELIKYGACNEWAEQKLMDKFRATLQPEAILGLLDDFEGMVRLIGGNNLPTGETVVEFLKDRTEDIIAEAKVSNCSPFEIAFLLQSQELVKAMSDTVGQTETYIGIEALQKVYPHAFENMLNLFFKSNYLSHHWVATRERDDFKKKVYEFLIMEREEVLHQMCSEPYVNPERTDLALKYFKNEFAQLLFIEEDDDVQSDLACGFVGNTFPEEDVLLDSFEKFYNPSRIVSKIFESLTQPELKAQYLVWAEKNLKEFLKEDSLALSLTNLKKQIHDIEAEYIEIERQMLHLPMEDGAREILSIRKQGLLRDFEEKRRVLDEQGSLQHFLGQGLSIGVKNFLKNYLRSRILAPADGSLNPITLIKVLDKLQVLQPISLC